PEFGRVIPNFIHQALNNEEITIFGDGSQTRSFIYVVDEIEGILKFVHESKAIGEVINLGNNKEVRGRGLMWGLEFNKETFGQLAMLSIIKEGVLQNYCVNKKDTLIMMPPLIVIEEEIEEIIKRIGEGVRKIKSLV
ncbi:unnamed protein product, partial [marine sediment metagenome]